MNNLATKPFLWIVGSIAGLMVIILGVAFGTVLTTKKVPFWPRAEEDCLSFKPVEPATEVIFDYPEYKDSYDLDFWVCNNSDSWVNTSAWFIEYDDTYIRSAGGGWGLPGRIYPADEENHNCKKAVIDIDMASNWTTDYQAGENPGTYAKFVITARPFCIGTSCAGCYDDKYITFTFGEWEEEPPEEGNPPEITSLSCAVPNPDTYPLTVKCTGKAKDSNGTIASATFDFNDGTDKEICTNTGNAEIVCEKDHAYENSGTYTIEFKATDNENKSATETKSVTLGEVFTATGTVVNANNLSQKISGATVTVGTPPGQVSGPTDTNGAFSIPGVSKQSGHPNVDYRVEVRKTGYATLTEDKKPTATGSLGEFRLTPVELITVKGVVVNARNNGPLSGATVTVDADRSGTTTSNGSFNITNVAKKPNHPQDSHHLKIVKTGYENFEGNLSPIVDRSNENTADLGTIGLAPTGTLRPPYNLTVVQHKSCPVIPDDVPSYSADFSWNGPSEADGYIVEISETDFNAGADYDTYDVGNLTALFDLDFNCNWTYSWRVWAYKEVAGASREGTYSPTNSFKIFCCSSGTTTCDDFYLLNKDGEKTLSGEKAIIGEKETVEIHASGSNPNGLKKVGFYYRPTDQSATCPSNWCASRNCDNSWCTIGTGICSGTTCNAKANFNATSVPAGDYLVIAQIFDIDGVPPEGCTGIPNYSGETWDSCPTCHATLGITSSGVLPTTCSDHNNTYYGIALSSKTECKDWWNDTGRDDYWSLDGWTTESSKIAHYLDSCEEWIIDNDLNGLWQDGSACYYYLPDNYLAAKSHWTRTPPPATDPSCVAFGECQEAETPGAGLSVNSVGLVPNFVDIGDEVRIRVNYSNTGGVPLPGAPDAPYLYLKAYIDESLVIEEGVYEGLGPGESKEYTTQDFWTTTEGNHTLKVAVESPLLDEAETSDNQAVLDFQVPTPSGQVCDLCGCTVKGKDCGDKTCNQECWNCLMKDANKIDGRYEYAYTYTVLGCLPVKPASFVVWFLRFATGIGGGIAFLLMVSGAFKVLTSRGDMNKLVSGKKTIKGAILGILVIVFAVIVLKIIGFDILRLPGFQVGQ